MICVCEQRCTYAGEKAPCGSWFFHPGFQGSSSGCHACVVSASHCWAISQTLCIFWNGLSLNLEVTGWVSSVPELGFQACTITMVILCGCWASKLKSSCMCGQYFIMEPSPQPLSSIISNNFPLLKCMCFYVQGSWTLQELGFYTCRQT